MKKAILTQIEEMGSQLPGGFFIYTADDREEILYANDVLLEIYGCSSMEEFKELTGNSFKGMVHKDDYAAVRQSIALQIEGSKNPKKRMDNVEYRLNRKDGEIRWVADYGRQVYTEENGKVYFVFIWDVTELRLATEENVRKAEVIEGLSVDYSSIYLVNLKTGEIKSYRLSEKYKKAIAGKAGGEVLRLSNLQVTFPAYADAFVLPEDRERFKAECKEERIRERVSQEKSYKVSYRVFGERDGDTVYMEMSLTSIGQGDDTDYVVMGFRDVTEEVVRFQKDMEDQLKLEMDLEREKRANEIKSAFLFNMSHDIRTPMNAIMGFSELAKRHIQEPELLEEYLGKIDASSKQLLALIDDVLEMGSIDYGRIDLHAQPLDLKEVLDNIFSRNEDGIAAKKLAFEKTYEISDEKVLLDEKRFSQVIGQLVSNAIKFTPEGGKVSFEAKRKQISESGYARYEFIVTDTGIGMSEDFQKKMFAAFEREESSTKSGAVGTGLGLSIAKRLVDMMGGTIEVSSKKGAGTKFIVDLPLKLADMEKRETVSAARPEGEEKPAGKAGVSRILLVEDIEINRELAETILEEEGFLVESVPDGCDAVEAVKNNPPGYYDLVLMDIQMPVMNGYEATRAIRALGREDTDRLLIIALSANAREEDRRMSMESGMNHHIAKPFDVARLLSVINEHLELGSSSQN
ncbi:MAG: response regulator [Lachnospiraceae bacterium]|nr:response regulator [Lachnospiraceae bacterium]